MSLSPVLSESSCREEVAGPQGCPRVALPLGRW